MSVTTHPYSLTFEFGSDLGLDLSSSEEFANGLTSVDLFAGAGGITQGLKQAGYRCLYANDFNAAAVDSFRYNHPEVWAECRSIEEVDPGAIRKELGLAVGELSLLAGGPPCQGFSINAPDRILEDPRNAMFRHYMRFLDEFKPAAFLFENVPGLLSLSGGVAFAKIMQEFERHGYSASARILFAAHYGVPQERWRLIILGSRSGPKPSHPKPTHFAAGRANFTGGRTMTIRLAPEAEARLQPMVSVGEAIGDLPRLGLGEGGEEVGYGGPARSAYANKLRNPAGGTFNHFAARLSKVNIQRLRHIGPGGSWRDIPFDLLPAGMKLARKSDHTKRYGRLTPHGLSGTIMTKCDPHWGAVFLPDQDRTLTVREAARLQSFPDSYRFLGSRVAQYEQVGNAVPVLMAEAIGRALVPTIKAIKASE